uniref:aminoglycoside phosphotransferase family protein n=1 Tax=Desertihabitans aurantiacus TaxID=2282477 RepID=UPI001300A5FE
GPGPVVDLGRAGRRGLACGRVHGVLAGVAAPAGLRVVERAPTGSRTALLHLDLHPLNVLVGDDDEVSAVVDWANARAGDPALDVARTWALLTAHPTVAGWRRSAAGAAFLDGWAEAAGFSALGDDARRWGLEFFLADQAGALTEDELGPARRLLADLRPGGDPAG